MPRGAPMSYCLNSMQLRLETARRGWDAINLARASRLSPATVSTALAGKPISAHSMNQIAKALAEAPVDEFLDRLLRPDSPGLGYA